VRHSWEAQGLELDLSVTPEQWRERCALITAHETEQLPIAIETLRLLERDRARAAPVRERRYLDGVEIDKLLEGET